VLVEYHVVVDELLRLEPVYVPVALLRDGRLRYLLADVAIRSSTFVTRCRQEWPTLPIALPSPPNPSHLTP
jgi:hypothetical protein